ncbi:DUF4244 domain-containing protein [Streptomyces monticola]|uniref:DUF4244 domain-containing protein n=1 Tax=Streptomyces monticola TaxID=2666263 RepID=A0ABW2JQE6_9ACTN
MKAVGTRVLGTKACGAKVYPAKVHGARVYGSALRFVRDRMRAGDSGMTTSEYALGTVAACGLAGVLYRVLTSDTVRAALESILGKALGVQF